MSKEILFVFELKGIGTGSGYVDGIGYGYGSGYGYGEANGNGSGSVYDGLYEYYNNLKIDVACNIPTRVLNYYKEMIDMYE